MKRTAALVGISAVLPLLLLAGTAQLVVLFLRGTVTSVGPGDRSAKEEHNELSGTGEEE